MFSASRPGGRTQRTTSADYHDLKVATWLYSRTCPRSRSNQVKQASAPRHPQRGALERRVQAARSLRDISIVVRHQVAHCTVELLLQAKDRNQGRKHPSGTPQMLESVLKDTGSGASTATTHP
jgi:hypothetical protein